MMKNNDAFYCVLCLYCDLNVVKSYWLYFNTHYTKLKSNSVLCEIIYHNNIKEMDRGKIYVNFLTLFMLK